jgi:hypothetical protein
MSSMGGREKLQAGDADLEVDVAVDGIARILEAVVSSRRSGTVMLRKAASALKSVMTNSTLEDVAQNEFKIVFSVNQRVQFAKIIRATTMENRRNHRT